MDDNKLQTANLLKAKIDGIQDNIRLIDRPTMERITTTRIICNTLYDIEPAQLEQVKELLLNFFKENLKKYQKQYNEL